jgi:hypothetical protein
MRTAVVPDKTALRGAIMATFGMAPSLTLRIPQTGAADSLFPIASKIRADQTFRSAPPFDFFNPLSGWIIRFWF